MPGFSLTPAQGFNPQTGEEFPNFIQFQADGTDLGGPDADVLNFGENLTATRGTGENANVVTVRAASGGEGGAVPTLVLELGGSVQGHFDGSDFGSWNGIERLSSADAQWFYDGDMDVIQFLRTGIYEIGIAGRCYAAAGNWPSEDSVIGSVIENAMNNERSAYSREDSSAPGWGSTYPFMQWFDTFLVNIYALDQTVLPRLYADAYASAATGTIFTAMVTVKRLGDSFLPT